MVKNSLKLFFLLNFAWILMAFPHAYAVEYKASSLRDPFQSVINETVAVQPLQNQNQPAAAPRWSLDGVVWDSDRPQAIVDGRIVEVGSKIGDAQVIAIDKQGVQLRSAGKGFYLRMKKEGT